MAPFGKQSFENNNYVSVYGSSGSYVVHDIVDINWLYGRKIYEVSIFDSNFVTVLLSGGQRYRVRSDRFYAAEKQGLIRTPSNEWQVRYVGNFMDETEQQIPSQPTPPEEVKPAKNNSIKRLYFASLHKK